MSAPVTNELSAKDAADPRFTVPAVVIPQGDGAYLVKPGKPEVEAVEVTPKEAAKFLKKGLSTIYGYLDTGAIPCRGPSPFKILIDMADMERFKAQKGGKPA
jgi:hypothetical protein